MDWSGTQFDFHLIDPSTDAGFGRFFSCNVSVPKALYDAAGGFDPEFVYYYEDLDFGWALDQAGMRLRYEPSARALHLHAYDWAALERRFDGIVIGERMMAAKHTWFEPWFKKRMADSACGQAGWGVVAGVVRCRGRARSQCAARRQEGAAPRAEPRQHAVPPAPRAALPVASGRARTASTSCRTTSAMRSTKRSCTSTRPTSKPRKRPRPTRPRSTERPNAYLYDLTAFGMWDTKVPYFEDLRDFLRPASRVLDYGCGIGTDGLRLIAEGHHVGFADFANPSTKYLQWRLDQRDLHPPVAEIFNIDEHVPGGFDLAYSFDVIEHVEDPPGFMGELESRADIVAVNLLEPDPHDVHLHKPLPIPALLDRAERQGILRYRKYHGRSHLVIYRSGGGGGLRAKARSAVERRLGARGRVARLLP